MRALLVDDEPLARRELRRLLAEFGWIEIVGEAGTLEEAATQIDNLAPDLLFLDIQMPSGSGFDLLARLAQPPQAIFTTASERHAVRAFEVHAVDYLLKPIEPRRLAAALARVDRVATSSTLAVARLVERLFIRDGQRCYFVPLREVRLLTSEGNYVRLFWGAMDPLAGHSLARLEQRLDAERFFRANRKQLINLDFVEELEAGLNGRLHVRLRGGPEVEISRRQARIFRSRMTL